jgi:hypothetical protein
MISITFRAFVLQHVVFFLCLRSHGSSGKHGKAKESSQSGNAAKKSNAKKDKPTTNGEPAGGRASAAPDSNDDWDSHNDSFPIYPQYSANDFFQCNDPLSLMSGNGSTDLSSVGGRQEADRSRTTHQARGSTVRERETGKDDEFWFKKPRSTRGASERTTAYVGFGAQVDPEDELFWNNYEKKLNEPGPTKNLFPPMTRTKKAKRDQPDLSEQPPDAILSGLVISGGRVMYLCRWDDYFPEAESSGEACGGGGDGEGAPSGKSRHLYCHVSAAELKQHCPQVLKLFQLENCGHTKLPGSSPALDTYSNCREPPNMSKSGKRSTKMCAFHVLGSLKKPY